MGSVGITAVHATARTGTCWPHAVPAPHTQSSAETPEGPSSSSLVTHPGLSSPADAGGRGGGGGGQCLQRRAGHVKPRVRVPRDPARSPRHTAPHPARAPARPATRLSSHAPAAGPSGPPPPPAPAGGSSLTRVSLACCVATPRRPPRTSAGTLQEDILGVLRPQGGACFWEGHGAGPSPEVRS